MTPQSQARHFLLLARHRLAMQRRPSGHLPGAARSAHRHSGDYRARTSFGVNGDHAAGMAQNPAAFPSGHARANGITGGSQQLDLARSPPSTANKSIDLPTRLKFCADLSRALQILNTFLANSSNKAPVRPDPPVLSFTRQMRRSIQLHANILQRSVPPRR